MYQTDLFGGLTSDVITASAAKDQPFFLWSSFYAPHSGMPVEPDDPINTLGYLKLVLSVTRTAPVGDRTLGGHPSGTATAIRTVNPGPRPGSVAPPSAWARPSR